jgi:hypothetical protein
MPYSADSETRKLSEGPPPEREADVLRAAVDLLRERLPTTWTLDAAVEPARQDPRVDAELRLRAPDGGEVTVLVEAKRLLNSRDVPVALEQLQRYAATLGEDDAVLVLAARYPARATST